jgi:signal transduction histidine kinase
LTHKQRVVVVDDLDSVRALVRATVGADERFEVVGEAADGAAALTLVDELRPDLVVLDLVMPGVDGLATLARLASEHPDVTVIVYSELQARRDEALANGASAFVSKVEPIEALIAVLVEVGIAPEQRSGLDTLRASEEQTYRFLEALPVGVAIVEQGRMVFINATGREILGTGPADALEGADIVEHFQIRHASTGELYPFDELPIVRALFHGETSSADDVVVSRPDGVIPVESYAAPVAGARGDRQYAVAAFTDVSERRAQDARLARALASLEAANEALMEFAAVAAHDLAAPLRSVSGFAQLLQDRFGEQLPEEARTWVDYILDEAERMREFIEELLAYARAGAPTDVVEVALTDLAHEAKDGLAAQIELTGATLIIEELPIVLGDRQRLAQVLQNLLSNSLKFRAPDRAPEVRVSADDDAGGWVITVADNGVGVPDSEAARIFAPFSRGEVGGNQPGHGLGLTICRRVIERHGGRIWVEPSALGGSAFRFSLPRAT